MSRCSFSLCGVFEPSGQEEDGLLSDVSSWAQFRSSVLLQGNIPVPLLIFLTCICVVVVLLQLLQEVTFISHGGLRRKHTHKTEELIACQALWD